MSKAKLLRRALLSGAALGAIATGAQADELADLKAQLEALQARVSQIESQPPPAALPEGASLVSVRRGQLSSSMIAPLPVWERPREHQGFTFSIRPTADMPVPETEVTLSGEIRARAGFISDPDFFAFGGFHDGDGGSEDSDGLSIDARGRLQVDGKTETAVGPVGATIRLESDYDGGYQEPWEGHETEDVRMDIAWGWWDVTPEFQLGGGYWYNTGSLQAGVDWQHTDLLGTNMGFTNTTNEQIRLTWKSSDGAFTAALSIEDNDAYCAEDFGYDSGGGEREFSYCAYSNESDIPQIGGYFLYDAGGWQITGAASWQKDESAVFAFEDVEDDEFSTTDSQDDWSAGLGVNGEVGIVSLTVGAVAGEDTGTAIFPLADVHDDERWWAISGGVIADLDNDFKIQLGGAFAQNLGREDCQFDNCDEELEFWDAALSVFWEPVDQLTLGVAVSVSHSERRELEEDDEGELELVKEEGEFIIGGFGGYWRF